MTHTREWGCYADAGSRRQHSWEYELHKLEAKDRIVFMTEAREHLEQEFGHRAIGVVYRPKHEHFKLCSKQDSIAIMPSFI
jgi:hypothetical protein